MKLNILTPQKKFYQGEILRLTTQDINGSLGILPNHSALITVIQESPIYFISSDEKEHKAAIEKGILKVNNENLTILCSECNWL